MGYCYLLQMWESSLCSNKSAGDQRSFTPQSENG